MLHTSEPYWHVGMLSATWEVQTAMDWSSYRGWLSGSLAPEWKSSFDSSCTGDRTPSYTRSGSNEFVVLEIMPTARGTQSKLSAVPD